LAEGLQRLSGKGSDEWGGEKLGDGEVRRRRDMLSAAKKEKDGLEGVLNTMAVKSAVSGASSSAPSTSSAAVTNEQKAALFKGTNGAAPSGRRVLGAPKETERTRELDNEGVLQLQKQIMQEQDEDLVDLTKVVRRMKEMGVQINEEIVEQNVMLGLLDEDVERYLRSLLCPGPHANSHLGWTPRCVLRRRGLTTCNRSVHYHWRASAYVHTVLRSCILIIPMIPEPSKYRAEPGVEHVL
jgi:hypothetical protein